MKTLLKLYGFYLTARHLWFRGNMCSLHTTETSIEMDLGIAPDRPIDSITLQLVPLDQPEVGYQTTLTIGNGFSVVTELILGSQKLVKTTHLRRSDKHKRLLGERIEASELCIIGKDIRTRSFSDNVVYTRSWSNIFKANPIETTLIHERFYTPKQEELDVYAKDVPGIVLHIKVFRSKAGERVVSEYQSVLVIRTRDNSVADTFNIKIDEDPLRVLMLDRGGVSARPPVFSFIDQ